MNDHLNPELSPRYDGHKLPPIRAVLSAIGDPLLKLPSGADTAIQNFAITHGLTRREHEVVTLICCGCKNDRIASILKLSSPTVRFHLRNIHRKSGTSDKLDIVLQVWTDSRN